MQINKRLLRFRDQYDDRYEIDHCNKKKNVDITSNGSTYISDDIFNHIVIWGSVTCRGGTWIMILTE